MPTHQSPPAHCPTGAGVFLSQCLGALSLQGCGEYELWITQPHMMCRAMSYGERGLSMSLQNHLS